MELTTGGIWHVENKSYIRGYNSYEKRNRGSARACQVVRRIKGHFRGQLTGKYRGIKSYRKFYPDGTLKMTLEMLDHLQNHDLSRVVPCKSKPYLRRISKRNCCHQYFL